MRFWIILSIIVPAMLALGCSGGGVSPTDPADEIRESAEGDGGTACLGVWQVVYDIASAEISATPLREGGYAVNVLGFMEPPPLKNLTVDFGTLNFHNPFLDVDVILTHPIPDTTFIGFDVRGIVFGPEVLNADGYTDFMSPEYFAGVKFGYIDGLLGVPNSTADYSDGRWGYKYFANGLGLNDDLMEFFSQETNLDFRGHFANGAQRVRHYELSWENTEPPIGFMVFNYAIYANYDWPTGEFPYDVDDFPISTANCSEPFCMTYAVTDNSLYYYMGEGGGEASVDIELWDWQGFDGVRATLYEGAGFGAALATVDSSVPGTTSKSNIFTFVNIEPAVASAQDLTLMVKAEDTGTTYGDAWFLGLLPGTNAMYDEYVCTYWYITLPVSEESPASYTVELDSPHAIDEPDRDEAPAIIANPSGHIYIGYIRRKNGYPSPTYSVSTNGGVTWDDKFDNYYLLMGGYPRMVSYLALDNLGGVYMKSDENTTAAVQDDYAHILKLTMNSSENRYGMYTTRSTPGIGNSFAFTDAGLPLPISSRDDTIWFKIGTHPNDPRYNGDAYGWWPLDHEVLVPVPSQLARTRNIIKESDGTLNLIYFSPNSNGTWIRTAYSSDGTVGSWNYGNDVYDGASDGYTRAREASIQYDADSEFHAIFILYSSTAGKEYLAYTNSSDGLNWSSPDIALEVDGADVLNDPTIDVVDMSGDKILLITYLEDDVVKLTYSDDDGITWQDPVDLSSGSDTLPDTCVTPDGNIHTCWMNEETPGGDTRIEYIRAHFVEG